MSHKPLYGLLFSFLLGCSPPGLHLNRSTSLDGASIKARVRLLASSSFEGRKPQTAGSAKAQAYIQNVFEVIGLLPIPGTGYRHKFAGGVNVVGLLPGRGANAGEFVVVGAHYDHLGRVGGKTYPGANDNASGVAVMTAVAASIVAVRPEAHRTVIFVAFDAEERGMLGSKAFVQDCPVNVNDIRSAIILDMVGTPMHPIYANKLAVLGTEKSSAIQGVVDELSGVGLLAVHRMGLHLLENWPWAQTYSDYGPFRDRNIPFAFVTAGLNRTFHQPTDTAASVSAPYMEGVSVWLDQFVRRVIAMSVRPVFEAAREDYSEDARTVASMLSVAVSAGDAFKNSLVRPSVIKRHQQQVELIRLKLMRGASLGYKELQELRLAAVRLQCYSAGPDSPLASTCNRF